MKKLSRTDYLPLCSIAIAVVGGILIACHVQLAGLILAAIGLVCAIVLYAMKKKLELNIYVVYWSLVACIAIVFLGALGFAGWTIWDIYTVHDVN